MSKLICIDYDNTYTADPDLWNIFIVSAQERGHEVICATMRYEEEIMHVNKSIGKYVSKVICTDRKGKKQYLESIGIKPDIWIDDYPYWILNDVPKKYVTMNYDYSR